MKFVETRVFTRKITEALSDEEYRHPDREMFLMLYVYDKNEQKDLTAAQKAVLGEAVRQEFK